MSSDVTFCIEKALIEIAKEEGVFDIVLDCKKGEFQGYLSRTSVINLDGRTKNGEKLKKSFLIKIASTNESLRECCGITEAFKREIYMYEHIFPVFYSFEKERNIENPFSSIPKFYKAFGNVKPEILILENLKESGYQDWDRKLQMNYDYVKLVLTEYGRFHATSFAVQDQNPQLFREITKDLQDNAFMQFLKSSGFLKTFIDKTKQVLALLDPNEDSKIYKKYKEFLHGIDEKFESLLSARDNFDAILHGDCWHSNMLFKYEICNKTQPSGIRLVDFQLAKLGSPIFDVVHFFYTCANNDVLKGVDKYKLIYYNSFSKHLKALGSNSETLYPFSVFDHHWKKYAIYGLILSPLINYALLSEGEEIKDYEQIIENGGNVSETFDSEIANMDEFKKRMKNVIEHFDNADLNKPALICSSKEVLDKFLEFYHAKLCDFVSELGSDPEKLFPYQILKEHWKKYSKYGLIMAATAIHAMLTKEEELIDLADVAESEGTVTAKTVINDNIKLLLQEVAKVEGFCKYEIKSSSGSVKGSGYTGIIISICITGEDETKTNKTLHLIVKGAPNNKALRENIPLTSAFEREIYMYSTLFPALHALEIEKELPVLQFAPQFYKAGRSHNNEAIVLENLKENGYVLYNAISPMNEEHVSLVLTKYARLHALSLAMQDQNTNEYRKIVEPLEDMLIKFFLGDFLNTIMHRCTKAKESLDSEVDKNVIQLYNNFVSDIPRYLEHMREATEEFSNDADLTKPADVRLLDFQISKVGSPVLDLCYFFYSCSSKEVIDKLDYFMQFYYGKLSDFVAELGSNPKKLFPYRILEEHWKKYAKYGLIMSVIAIHAMLTEKEETIDLGNVAESEGSISNAFNYEIKNIDEYNNRIKHIILHFYVNNFL
ncbi:hypothetical protein ILUMI_01582 [Ignelater luminosus]|uniref:CHK kinase-like domain-containing protein n=1 Tax=Ignelater luminosus TaxID=2038154 RepID=A0A8K0DF23_IGNLU|nr:hypothetical protein ILUMI_01582 [Ignelater luminosus]